jgi:hypothetical protein
MTLAFVSASHDLLLSLDMLTIKLQSSEFKAQPDPCDSIASFEPFATSNSSGIGDSVTQLITILVN